MAQATAKKMPLAGVLKTQRVRVRKESGDRGFLLTAGGAALIVLLLSFVYIWSRVNVVKYGYDISQANNQRTVLMEKSRRLRLEETRLRSPERIEKVALGELGLIYPAGAQTIRVK